jgi:hypothetical protein
VTCAEADEMRCYANGRCAPGIRGQRTSGFGRLKTARQCVLSTGELNKLASNVALGRDMAGVHWRSDAKQALLLGEAVTISILRDQRPTYNEPFDGFTFTKFDGKTITV